MERAKKKPFAVERYWEPSTLWWSGWRVWSRHETALQRDQALKSHQKKAAMSLWDKPENWRARD